MLIHIGVSEQSSNCETAVPQLNCTLPSSAPVERLLEGSAHRTAQKKPPQR